MTCSINYEFRNGSSSRGRLAVIRGRARKYFNEGPAIFMDIVRRLNEKGKCFLVGNWLRAWRFDTIWLQEMKLKHVLKYCVHFMEWSTSRLVLLGLERAE